MLKKFIMTGFAVAVILEGAVGLVVKGFVADIVMPIVGHFASGLDVSELKYVLDPAVLGSDGAEISSENAIRYGAWVNSFINLLTVGLVMFIVVKSYNKTKALEPQVAPAGPSEQDILKEVRDSLKK